MKKCTKCGLKKPLDAFYKSTATKDGLCYPCKECDHKAKKAYLEKNRDEINSKRRQAYHKNPDKQRQRSQQRRQKNAKKCKAVDHNYYVRNRERILEASMQRHWRLKTADPFGFALAARARHLKRKYGLSLAQYERLLRKQGDLCALCRQPMKHGGRLTREHAVVDHDHKTGVVRGILHTYCNVLLGAFDNDPRLLLRLTKYLSKSKKNSK